MKSWHWVSLSILMLAIGSARGETSRKEVSISGDLNVVKPVSYKDSHLKVHGNVNLFRGGALSLDGCVLEIIGQHARQFGCNWKGGTLTTRKTTIGGTLANGVAQQANFKLDDGLWMAEDTTVRYTYGIEFSSTGVGRLRAKRLIQGPNSDSIICSGNADVELVDSKYWISLVLNVSPGRHVLNLPVDKKVTGTINRTNTPGATFNLKMKGVTVPGFWFVFFNGVTMHGAPCDVTFKNCSKVLPCILGTDLTGEVTMDKTLEKPFSIGNLTLRRFGRQRINAFSLGLYLYGKNNNLVVKGPINICELMIHEGKCTLQGTAGTFDAFCAATTLDVHPGGKVELINARLGYWKKPADAKLKGVVGQATVDAGSLVGRNISIGRVRLIAKNQGWMWFDPYIKNDKIDETISGKASITYKRVLPAEESKWRPPDQQ